VLLQRAPSRSPLHGLQAAIAVGGRAPPILPVRALGLQTAYYGDDRWLEIACEEPMILRMPLVRRGSDLIVGFTEVTWKEWVAK